MKTRLSFFIAAIIFAITSILPTMTVLADEAFDAATAEMKAALGTVPAFIAMLPKGA